MRTPALLLAALALGAAGDPARGRAVVLDRSRGLCTLCHAIPGATGPQGDLGPGLAGIGARASRAELWQRINDPRVLNPATVMPTFGSTAGTVRVGRAWQGRPILSADEVEDVVAFLQTVPD